MFWSKKNKSKRHPEMSDEELVRTQVLNLNEVKKVANYEKKTNRKPALVCAVLGMLCITIGASYPLAIEALAPVEIPKKTERVDLKEENTLTTKVRTLTCTDYKTNLLNTGTDELTTDTFNFENGDLKDYTRVITLNQTAGKTNGKKQMASYEKVYKELSNNTLGYKVETAKTATGMQVSITVDLKVLDKTKVPKLNMENDNTAVKYNQNEKIETIKKDYKEQGIECK